MEDLRVEAMAMIQKMPDSELVKLIAYLQSLQDNFKDSMSAYEELQKYRRPSEVDIDYKAEFQNALEEKYENIG